MVVARSVERVEVYGLVMKTESNVLIPERDWQVYEVQQLFCSTWRRCPLLL